MGAEFSHKPTTAELKQAAMDPDQAVLGSDRLDNNPPPQHNEYQPSDACLNTMGLPKITPKVQYVCESTDTAKILDNLDKRMATFHSVVEAEETKMGELYDKAEIEFAKAEKFHIENHSAPYTIAHIKEEIFSEFRVAAERHYHMSASELSFTENAQIAKDYLETGRASGRKGDFGIAQYEFGRSRDLATEITTKIQEYLDAVGDPDAEK